MNRTTFTDFFEEVETIEKYNGYFCSIAEESVNGKDDYLPECSSLYLSMKL